MKYFKVIEVPWSWCQDFIMVLDCCLGC